jgi:hypothetical protein
MAQDEHVVVDPLNDAGRVFAWLGDRLATIPLPRGVPGPVYEPPDYGGDGLERLGLLQADHELTASARRALATISK